MLQRLGIRREVPKLAEMRALFGGTVGKYTDAEGVETQRNAVGIDAESVPDFDPQRLS